MLKPLNCILFIRSSPFILTLRPQRLVRFLAKNGKTYYGDAILPEGVTDLAKTKKARVIKGDIFGQHEVTDQVADVRLLLAPLALDDVKTVRCLGLNYALHAKEAGLPLPKYPVLFVSNHIFHLAYLPNNLLNHANSSSQSPLYQGPRIPSPCTR